MSWQMQVVAGYVRLTRSRRYATAEAGRAVLRRPKASSAPPPRIVRGLTVTRTERDGFDVYVVDGRHGGSVGSTHRRIPAPVPKGVVLYLHGGAYVNEIARQHWQVVARLARDLRCQVHVPIYGLAPRHHVHEALDLVCDVLADLGREGRPVHLVGDSAGGGLALVATQSCRLEARAAVVGATLVAPWLDLSLSNPGIDAVEPADPWLSRAGLRPIAQAWAAGLPLDDPRVSPIRGDLTRLPPLHLWVGTRDITVADCRDLMARAPAGLLDYHEWPGAIHDFPLLPTPEGRQALRAIVEDIGASLRGADADARARDGDDGRTGG